MFYTFMAIITTEQPFKNLCWS